jgi:hypothetical protein
VKNVPNANVFTILFSFILFLFTGFPFKIRIKAYSSKGR